MIALLLILSACDDSDSDEILPTWAIISIAVGGGVIVLLAILIPVIVCCCKSSQSTFLDRYNAVNQESGTMYNIMKI